MAAQLVNGDFKTQRMLSNKDIVLLLIGITKQFYKDPQSPWGPTAFVAVVGGDGSSFLGRGAGAASFVGGGGQRARSFPWEPAWELSGTDSAPRMAGPGEKGLNTQACPSPRQG